MQLQSDARPRMRDSDEPKMFPVAVREQY